LRDYNFGLKVDHDSIDDLSCMIHVHYENKTAFVIKPHLIKTLEEKFGDEVNNLSEYGTPSTPRFNIVSPVKTLKELI
jgi:hypothetical protein